MGVGIVEYEGHRYPFLDGPVGTVLDCLCHPEKPTRAVLGIDGEVESYVELPVDWGADLDDDGDGAGIVARPSSRELRFGKGDTYRVRILSSPLSLSRVCRHPWIGTSLACTVATAPGLLPEKERGRACPICALIEDEGTPADLADRLRHRVEWRVPVLVLGRVGTGPIRYPTSRPYLLRLTERLHGQAREMGGLRRDIVVEVGRNDDEFGSYFIRTKEEKLTTPEPRLALPPFPPAKPWPEKSLADLVSTIRAAGWLQPKLGRVDHWRGHLPDAVLIACVWGTKKPMRSGYLDPARVHEWMRDAHYLQRMDEGAGIALSLMAPYAVIDLDRDEDVHAFVTLNPWAHDALQIIGGRGCKFVVRMVGDYPNQVLNATVDLTDGSRDHVGEFRGHGLAMLDGLHPSGRLYRYSGNAIPELVYNNIRWPAGWVLDRPRDKVELEQYGGDAVEGGLLDVAKLRNVRPHPRKEGAQTAQCPACAEQGSDSSGDHLIIFGDGRYGCVTHAEDTEHRSRILALAGRRDRSMIRVRGNSEDNWREVLGAEIATILSNDEGGPKGRPISEAVIAALAKAGTFYRDADQPKFHSCYWFSKIVGRLYGIADDIFKAWLADWSGLFPGSTFWPQVTTAVAYHALQNGAPVRPEAYWFTFDGKVYLSCGPASVTRISAEGIEVVPNGTDGVLFLPDQTCAPWELLPVAEAEDPFADCQLFRDASLTETCRHGKLLAQLWAYCLPASSERPPLALVGDGGSGKTPFGEGLQRLLVGTSSILTIDKSVTKGDVMVTLDGGGVALLDNADSTIPWFCDFLASVTTGGEQHKRQLYTDKDRIRLRSRAGIVLTSAMPLFAGDANVSDRLVVVMMRRRDSTIGKVDLFGELQKKRDRFLSHMVHTLAAALADKDPVPSGLNQRFPEFASLAVRVGRALGREAEVVSALREAESDKSRLALQSDDIAGLIRDYVLQSERFLGTAAELAEEIEVNDSKFVRVDQLTSKVAKRLQTHWVHFARVFSAAKVKDRKDVTRYCLLAEPGREDEALALAQARIAGRGRSAAGGGAGHGNGRPPAD